MNEQSSRNGTAVKMVAEDDGTFTVGGYGVVWGGADVARERFTPDTDFWFDRLTETPMVLYRHGLEGKMARTVVGQVCEKKADDFGLWIEAQIKDHEDYSDALRALVKKGVLGWSSGAVGHLVDKVKKGGVTEILSWPVAEWSLVPDPCEPRTIGVAEVKALSPELITTIDTAIKSKLTAAQAKKLPDADFAYIDADGNRHLPIHDAAHVRAALSRFNQTQFESPSAKAKAKRRIMVRAKKFGIDTADTSGKSWSLAFMGAEPCGEDCCEAYKALPDGPTLMSDDDGGPYPEGSYEDLAEDIAQALRVQTNAYAYTVATFPSYALVRCCDDDGETDDVDDYGMRSMAYFRVAYTLDDEGEPVLGEMEKVEPAMIPAKAVLVMPQTDEAPLTIKAARLGTFAALVAEDTKGLSERRIKEGRVLSGTNRDRLSTTADALESALKALRDLLDTTEPQTAKAASEDRTAELRRRARDFEVLQLFADTLDSAA